jgi:hypothetical protein
MVASFIATPLFTVPASAQIADEHAVRVAFVLNLTKYVEWPHKDSRITIAVVGEGPTADELKKVLDGQSSESRPIRVVLSPSDAQLQECNILYVTYTSPSKVRLALDRVRDQGILTVGDSDFFARDGGMVGLVTRGDRIQIEVNLETAEQAGLKISSRLLRLSKVLSSAAKARD